MHPVIAPEVCTACERCVRECPVGAISCVNHAVIDPNRCIGCGHCGVVCEAGAVSSEAGVFVPITEPSIAPAAWCESLASRRSVRKYLSKPLAREFLSAILDSAKYAPTASNSRDVEVLVLEGLAVHEFAAAVNDFYRGLLALFDRRWLRPFLWFTSLRPYLRQRERIEQLRSVVHGFDAGADWLLYDAPTVMVLCTPRKNRMFGRVNAVIAAERMLTCAWGLGVGSCWIGYAEVALAHQPRLARLLGLPPDRCPHVVVAFGHPATAFERLPARAPLPVRFLGTQGLV